MFSRRRTLVPLGRIRFVDQLFGRQREYVSTTGKWSLGACKIRLADER